MRTEMFRHFSGNRKYLVIILFFYSLSGLAQPKLMSAVNSEPKTGAQKFTIRTESKSFEKTKFRKLSEAKAAVEKYRRSFSSRAKDLNKRCQNHFGPGYSYNGLSVKPRAIGYMNEDLPIDLFSWKRLIVEVYIQCFKPE